MHTRKSGGLGCGRMVVGEKGGGGEGGGREGFFCRWFKSQWIITQNRELTFTRRRWGITNQIYCQSFRNRIIEGRTICLSVYGSAWQRPWPNFRAVSHRNVDMDGWLMSHRYAWVTRHSRHVLTVAAHTVTSLVYFSLIRHIHSGDALDFHFYKDFKKRLCLLFFVYTSFL